MLMIWPPVPVSMLHSRCTPPKSQVAPVLIVTVEAALPTLPLNVPALMFSAPNESVPVLTSVPRPALVKVLDEVPVPPEVESVRPEPISQVWSADRVMGLAIDISTAEEAIVIPLAPIVRVSAPVIAILAEAQPATLTLPQEAAEPSVNPVPNSSNRSSCAPHA